MPEKGINLAQFPAFDNYIRYVLLSDGIKADALFAAVTRLSSILGLLATTPDEKRLAALSEQLSLMGKLTEFALTLSEWKTFEAMDYGPWSIDQNLSPFKRFYQEADLRSELMLKNLKQAANHQSPHRFGRWRLSHATGRGASAQTKNLLRNHIAEDHEDRRRHGQRLLIRVRARKNAARPIVRGRETFRLPGQRPYHECERGRSSAGGGNIVDHQRRSGRYFLAQETAKRHRAQKFPGN